MLTKAKKTLSNQKGQAFIENALYIIIVVLVVAGAGYLLANDGIKAKFSQIQSSVGGVSVPNIGH